MTSSTEERIVAALRGIMRAVDLHSRQLVRACGLTGPQLITLQKALAQGPLTAGNLARAVQISQSTLTGILDRLESRGLIERRRGPDRRSVTVTATSRGAETLGHAPSLLHDRFRKKLSDLGDHEQDAMLAALQRLAGMMGADGEPRGGDRGDGALGRRHTRSA
jgi:DNA-binding MarR family transcriptional regulator